MLATFYDTGAKVQELVDLTVGDVRLQKPAVITLPGRDGYPVFFDQQHAKLSRGGIAWVIDKYGARMGAPDLARVKISPHILRHNKSMHLYEAGIPLPYIRDILGHIDLSTTEIYASVSTEAKRKALEAAYVNVISSNMPEWNQNAGLLVWITSL
ncbi:tyrosine-type recombinase/integrase [Salmonella enterica subsp. enterica serovar Oslo]|nr:tyrosine-type recombinase/integrase [Salmonella enterica subsp. enterica serovar Oslo]